MLAKLCLFILLSINSDAYAMKFKIRAREHIESHKFDVSGTEAKYKGLSNTINFWWEMPYELYYGFYFTPVISSLKEKDEQSALGEEIVLYSAGIAAKYFVHKLFENVYGRIEYGYAELHPDGTQEKATGHSILMGFGYEYPLEMFGLALEAAFRYSDLSKNISGTAFTPSIGFHFYEVF